jgi:hypothetical protein
MRKMRYSLNYSTIHVAEALVLLMAFAPMTFASDTNDAAGVKKEVNSAQQDQTEEKRKALFEEATAAIREAKNALKALDEKKPKEALAALEVSSGKLTIILGREPELALAPSNVDVVTYDILADIYAVKEMRDEIEDALDDGPYSRHAV